MSSKRYNVKTLWGAGIVFVILVMAILAPLISPYGSQELSRDILSGPGVDHWFGTDRRGMDIFSRTLFAPRVDLLIGLGATALAFVIGIPLGTIAGMFENQGRFGGFCSQLIMRGMDVAQAFPVFVFALAIVAVLGAGPTNVIFALAFVNIPVVVRQIRASVLVLREQPFVDAALIAGWSRLRLAFRHVLPNALGPAGSLVSVMIGFSILMTAGLSFIGAGVRLPTAEWGIMVSEGSSQLGTGQWWPSLFPGLSLAVTVFGFALLGEGLREAPRGEVSAMFSPTRRWAVREFG